LTVALRFLEQAERRSPHDGDRPPPSVFPSTPASRAALRYDREARERLAAGKHRRTFGTA
jgi:hypothetical protein